MDNQTNVRNDVNYRECNEQNEEIFGKHIENSKNDDYLVIALVDIGLRGASLPCEHRSFFNGLQKSRACCGEIKNEINDKIQNENEINE